MNERILKLREQASQWVVANHQRQDPNTLSQKEIDQRYLMYEEKFAELIVRECVEVCASIAAVRSGYNDADGRDTAYSCGDTIKEHFGVLE